MIKKSSEYSRYCEYCALQGLAVSRVVLCSRRISSYISPEVSSGFKKTQACNYKVSRLVKRQSVRREVALKVTR